MENYNKNSRSEPDPEIFKKKVEEMEKKYGITDCVYDLCIREFSKIRLGELNEEHEIRIIRPFLLAWGNMTRVLGYNGVKAICRKLIDISEKIEPLRKKDFTTVNLDEIKDQIIELFDELRKTKFMSKKGKQKEVGSTATSKMLHLTCPDLFIMWDSAIRTRYGKNDGDGKDYFEFLMEMQRRVWKKLRSEIEELRQKYGKKVTRIIDQYNWGITH